MVFAIQVVLQLSAALGIWIIQAMLTCSSVDLLEYMDDNERLSKIKLCGEVERIWNAVTFSQDDVRTARIRD